MRALYYYCITKLYKDYASTTRDEDGGGLAWDRARAGGDTESRKRFLRRSVIVPLSAVSTGRLR